MRARPDASAVVVASMFVAFAGVPSMLILSSGERTRGASIVATDEEGAVALAAPVEWRLVAEEDEEAPSDEGSSPSSSISCCSLLSYNYHTFISISDLVL